MTETIGEVPYKDLISFCQEAAVKQLSEEGSVRDYPDWMSAFYPERIIMRLS